MAKKKSKKKQVQPRTNDQEEFLKTLIRYTERAITDQGSSIDELFTQQAVKLKKQLKELGKSK